MLRRITVFTLALLALFTGGVGSVIGTTENEPIVAERHSYVFNNEKLLFGAWCYTRDDRFLALCKQFKEAGLQFFINNGEQRFTEKELAWMDENDIGFLNGDSAYSRSLTNRCAWGVVLRDEPGALEYDALAKRVQEDYARAPDRLPFINLLPLYASGNQLQEEDELLFSNDVFGVDAFDKESVRYRMYLSDYIGKIDSDILSFDIYPLTASRKTGSLGTYSYWLRNLDIVAEACRAANRDLWVVTQAAGNLLEGGGMRYCNEVEDQRWQNYVTLAFGAKAIIYACYYTGWWDGDSHMIDDSGKQTKTYDAVKEATAEIAAFSDLYMNYENHGAVLYNQKNETAAGAKTGLLRVPLYYRPILKTDAPVLCGCFTEKGGSGKAFVLANMNQPSGGKDAEVTLQFPFASKITVFRKGEKTEYHEKRLTLTLENREGVFLTVE